MENIAKRLREEAQGGRAIPGIPHDREWISRNCGLGISSCSVPAETENR